MVACALALGVGLLQVLITRLTKTCRVTLTRLCWHNGQFHMFSLSSVAASKAFNSSATAMALQFSIGKQGCSFDQAGGVGLWLCNSYHGTSPCAVIVVATQEHVQIYFTLDK